VSAKVSDIWINPPADAVNHTTRRILRVELVDNAQCAEERIKACILHQRRHTKGEEWRDVDAFKLTNLKAGEEVRLQLSCADTADLHKHLSQVAQICATGIPQGAREFEVVDKDRMLNVPEAGREVIRKFITNGDNQIWDELNKLEPQLFQTAALIKLHQIRESAVQTFKRHLASLDWNEADWQRFFEQNTWIFGYGLSYRFLSTVQNQPHYGGMNVSGKGDQRGDFLMTSEAAKRFTVLVEIKKPTAPLTDSKTYRNDAWRISIELAGAVAQIQTNCRMWEIEGANSPANFEGLNEKSIYTTQPKGFVIIGLTSDLKDRHQRNSFEIFRRNLINPEVITFDELLERAQHLLLNEETQLHSSPVPSISPADDPPPF
jgi:hypothetical protein